MGLLPEIWIPEKVSTRRLTMFSLRSLIEFDIFRWSFINATTLERGAFPALSAQSVDGRMYGSYAGTQCRIDIGNGQVVVVVGMKIKVEHWKVTHQDRVKLKSLCRVEDSKRILEASTS